MDIRVLLVDDHQMMREGLRTLLDRQPGIQVVGEAVDGWEAVRLARELAPAVVIMDVSLPGLNGIEATHQIAGTLPETKVIALSVHSDKRFVAEMLKAGASGYLLKAGAFDELVSAIIAVALGQTYLSPRVATFVVDAFRDQHAEKNLSAYSILTAREREVLQLLAEGHTTKSTAQVLGISIKTVEVHRQNVMDKLQLHNLAELVKYAIREGLITLDP